MALIITDNLKNALESSKTNPVMLLKLDGIDKIYGNISIKQYVRIGDPDLFIGNDWFIGGFKTLQNQHPYITYNVGNTTTKISQKLDPSRGLGSSVTQMSITLIDNNQEITELVSPGFEVNEMLGRSATVYLGVEDSSFPEDFNVIMQGVVENVSAGPNYVTLFLNNTEEKKRAQILPPITGELSAPLNYRSILFQDIFYKNRDDVASSVTVTYTGGGTAGSEVVTVVGSAISVQIQSGVSTAAQIRKAIENNASANQLVEAKIQGSSSNAQVTGAVSLVIDDLVVMVADPGFVNPSLDDTLRTYAIIGDELLEYTTLGGATLGDCARAQEGSIGQEGEPEDEVRQAIRLKGNGIDIALKLMMSGGPFYFLENQKIRAFGYYDSSTIVDNAIFFSGIDVETEYGVHVGCLVDTAYDVGIGEPALNLLAGSVVIEVGKVENGSYVVVSDTLIPQTATNGFATCRFTTPYNSLPIGLKMLPKEVDVQQHQFIRDTFLPILELDIFTDEIESGKEFLENEVYRPMTCFSVPRKGRSSIVLHVGPLPTYEVVTLNEKTVENPEKLIVQRGISENFFNRIVFNIDYDLITDKFKKTLSQDSEIATVLTPGIGPKVLTIPSKGMRTLSDGIGIADRSSARFLKRYERGAEFIKGIKPNFRYGYQIEIGDIVAVDYAALKLADFSTGNREGSIKLMEVLNKTLDNKSGEVKIDVVNTIFQTNSRFGFISPATIIGVGSTEIKLVMKKSYGTRIFERESNKWKNKIGYPVTVRTEDFSQSYNTVIRGFDNNDPQGMAIDAIPVAPGENWIIESPSYPTTLDTQDMFEWKSRYAYFSPQVAVISSASQTTFVVDPADIGKFVGQNGYQRSVLIHNLAFTDEAPEALVIGVDLGTNMVTIDTPTGFTINSTHKVDLIGFSDGQPAYRIV